MAILQMDQVRCRYGDTVALDDFTLEVREGEIAVLLGPSGCGKTTALRAVLGFEPVEHGEVRIHDQIMSRPGFRVPPEQRPVGMVFQDRALFPHLTVARNISIGIRRESQATQKETVSRLLGLVGLEGHASRYPHELSGGQQERVALARALAPRPQLLLLDEPFASLDSELRRHLSLEVRNILRETRSTAVVVTHNQAEAFLLGDRIGILRDGAILQLDTPYNVYHRPASRGVASFVGRGVFLPGVLAEADAFDTELGRIYGRRHGASLSIGAQVDILLRPDDVLIDPAGDVAATVVEKAFEGDDILYTLRLASGAQLLALASSHKGLAIGEETRLKPVPEHLVAFPRGEGQGSPT